MSRLSRQAEGCRAALTVLAVGLCLTLGGCHRKHPAEAPPLTSETASIHGIEVTEVSITQFPERERLWIYIPTEKKRSHPCVFIAANGANLVSGRRLEESDRAEHLPFAKAGYVVVAYEVSGAIAPGLDFKSVDGSIRLFVKRRAGIANGVAAVDYAVKHLPVDPLRLYAVGHGASATLALLLASNDSRLRGCVAEAPVVDVADFISGNLGDEVRYYTPQLINDLKTFSPVAFASRLRCPVFVRASSDDDVVPRDSLQKYVDQVKRVNHQLDFSVVDSGPHFNGPNTEGISESIAWLGRDRRP